MFQSHASHHLVAIYAMGAPGPTIEAAYQTHVVYMRPSFEAPEPVTEDNFWKHLGKRECVPFHIYRVRQLRYRRFYNSYLEFFRALLLKKDVTEVIEEYIFSPKANIGGPVRTNTLSDSSEGLPRFEHLARQ